MHAILENYLPSLTKKGVHRQLNSMHACTYTHTYVHMHLCMHTYTCTPTPTLSVSSVNGKIFLLQILSQTRTTLSRLRGVMVSLVKLPNETNTMTYTNDSDDSDVHTHKKNPHRIANSSPGRLLAHATASYHMQK